MKTIGILGGTGWVSTAAYYSLLNQEINSRTKGEHYARCIIYSVNFSELMAVKHDGAAMYSFLKDTIDKLVLAGADCLLLAANTLHMFAPKLSANIEIPIIHIAEATAMAIQSVGLKKVGLLGTKQTMEKDFYKTILRKSDIEVITPDEADRDFIDHTILHEFFHEKFTEETRNTYLSIIDKLRNRGTQGIILGCTEIPLLLQQKHCDLPLFNTTEIHVKAAVDFALGL
ncbi:MAG: aspartate/glutamate racemase family protein [Bacteroidales bacterium]